MKPALGLIKVIAGPPPDDLFLKGQVRGQNVLQTDPHWPLVINCHHIEVVIDLQVSVFQEVVQDPVCVGVPLELNCDLQAAPVGFVPRFNDSFHLLG